MNLNNFGIFINWVKHNKEKLVSGPWPWPTIVSKVVKHVSLILVYPLGFPCWARCIYAKAGTLGSGINGFINHPQHRYAFQDSSSWDHKYSYFQSIFEKYPLGNCNHRIANRSVIRVLPRKTYAFRDFRHRSGSNHIAYSFQIVVTEFALLEV